MSSEVGSEKNKTTRTMFMRRSQAAANDFTAVLEQLITADLLDFCQSLM